MDDPQPENVVGRKMVDHRIEWKIRPSYLIGVVAILYLVYRVFGDNANQKEGLIGDDHSLEAEMEIDLDNPGWRNAKVVGVDTGR